MNYSKKDRWNKRYRALQKLPQPNSTLIKFYKLAPLGRALDIACGAGQNAIFLLQKGFEVDAVDFSQEALKFIDKKIKTYCCDIKSFDFKKEYYDLIINFNFLERSIFSKIKMALKSNGILIFETFNYNKKDSNPNYLLTPNELLVFFNDLHILFYEEIGERTILVARKQRYLPKKNPHVAQTLSTKRKFLCFPYVKE